MTTGKVLKERRAPRERGRTGSSLTAARARRGGPAAAADGDELPPELSRVDPPRLSRRDVAALGQDRVRAGSKRARERGGDGGVVGRAEGRSIRSDVGVELKGVRSGVERRRGVSGLKVRDPGRRESPGEKVFKDRRSPRGRGRTGTGVRKTHLRRCAENSSFWSRSINPLASDSNFSTSKPPNASVPYGDRDGSLAPMATKYTVTCTRS